MSLRVGVVGTGMIGQDHIRRLTQVVSGVEVVAVSDIDRARAAAAAPEGAEVFDTPHALIGSDRVQAVVICSWGPAHEEQLLGCIAAGKPVFCEKPLVTSEAAALHVMDAEVAFGRRLVQVGFMRRFDADYRRLKAVIDGDSLGVPLLYHSVHRNASVPEGLYTSEMPLNDTLVHDADISRWLLDDEVTGVEVRVPRRSRRGKDLRDPTLVLLHMASGALVDVEISVNIAYGYDIRGEVSCEEGVAALPNRPATVVKRPPWHPASDPEDWRERFIEAYDQEFREWIVAASQGTATGPSTWDGYAATLVAEPRCARSKADSLNKSRCARNRRSTEQPSLSLLRRDRPRKVKKMLNGEKLIDRPLRWGMVGGGRTGQVGYKHRTGALRDNTAYQMVCGAFDLDFERGKDFGAEPRGRRGPALSRLQDADRRGSEACRRGRGRHHRDTELHPLRDHQSLSRSRPARDLREAALLHREGVRGDRGARRRRRA